MKKGAHFSRGSPFNFFSVFLRFETEDPSKKLYTVHQNQYEMKVIEFVARCLDNQS